jgi:hypothetical protein
MNDHRKGLRASSALILLSVTACFGPVGCSGVRSEPNVEEGGLLESPTHEADALRREEERRQQQDRGGNGGY